MFEKNVFFSCFSCFVHVFFHFFHVKVFAWASSEVAKTAELPQSLCDFVCEVGLAHQSLGRSEVGWVGGGGGFSALVYL